MSSTSSNRPKKYMCSYEGCEKAFTRSDHLQRHMLNHGDGSSTCPRCGLHFKRPDLLDRHMVRHRQRDEEAGGEGFGIIESRKKLWKDANGNIVKKRPPPGEICKVSAKKSTTDPNNHNQSAFAEGYNSQALHAEPPSPPKSMLSVESFEQLTHQLPDLPDEEDFMDSTVAPNMFDFLANSSWGLTSAASLNIADDMPFGDMFNPDTASSFNMPFTTMHNYNWLFDIGDATCSPISTNMLLNSSVVPESQRPSQENQSYDMQRKPAQPLPVPTTFSSSRRMTSNDMAEESYTQHSSLQHLRSVEGSRNAKAFQSSSMTSTGSAVAPTITSFPPMDQNLAGNLAPEIGMSRPSTTSRASTENHTIAYPSTHHSDEPTPYTNTQGFSPIQPRTMMPAMDDSSRIRLLDLLINARLRTPEGLEITHDHPLLSLSAMQNYLELFFSRFNVTYPLLHQPTFNPSQAEPLLLLSVLLLGATYSDKAIHRLAVCIHDILRAQIFQHSSFSATPELWILQTILLVECFGKSRAGQRQHDMSHLFHGLLINLIRRSDCQTVRQPNFSDALGDLESNWRKAIDVELRKRQEIQYSFSSNAALN
ncbi:uncharacterized protein PV07_10669 [Cladophialophora immunda]|uniref:C2H2-type domain-containing protein n=1 Tax=Cladophialophora immunda TaxID=569365 RepID=A0A0D2C138_9EURO|nr:uncharacterized protein PV07_10669 [Cladophialophora immunda]KIW24993.1 hypothetical protein PV07_10669 [Cladophialophora immunda]